MTPRTACLHKVLVLRLPVIVLLLYAAATMAQRPLPALEEIIVTARKRPESLQDVPASVSVAGAERLADAAVGRLAELQAYIPDLVVTETAIGSNLFVRGIGSGINQGFEQSVGIYVDGIYYGRAQLSRMPLFDLARVEVLKGPQSTLFGKNSIAGALNVVTAGPTDAFGAELRVGYETEIGATEVVGVVAGPLGDRFDGRLALRLARSDGYIENSLLDRDEPRRDERALRLSLGWNVSDDARLSLKAETARFDRTGREIEITADRPALAGPFAGLTYGEILAGVFSQPPEVLDHTPDYRRGSNGDFSNNDADAFVLTADWSAGSLGLTSITGYVGYEYDELCDCDLTAANVFSSVFSESFSQVSQELRLTSPAGGALEYIAGVYLQRSDLDFFDSLLLDSGSVVAALVDADPTIPSPPFPPAPGTSLLANTASPRVFSQQARVAALFGKMTWHIADRFRLGIGARITDETKTAARTLTFTNLDGTALPSATAPLTIVLYNRSFNATPHSISGDRSKRKLMPSLTLEWDATGNILTYLAVAKGFKSGGFDARSNNPPVNALFPASVGSFEFDDEQALNVEVGTKAILGGGRAELYAALYETNYDDLQVSAFDGTLGFNVGNAGAARVRGLELESRFRVTERLLLSASLARTDFEYETFFGQCYFGQLPDAPDGVNCDYRGRTNEYVPDWSGILSIDWTAPIGGRLEFRWLSDLTFTDAYFLSPTLNPGAVQDGYVKLDTRVSIGRADGRWEIALTGRNLTDQSTLSYGNETPLAATAFGAPGFFGFVDPPRSAAIRGTFRFR